MISAASTARQSIPDNPPTALPCADSSPSKSASFSAISTEEPLTWTVHLLRERRDKMAGIVAAFLLITVWAVLVFHNLLIALVGCIVASGAIKEYIAPLKFTLDSEQVTVRCADITWIEMTWEQVRSVYRTPAGLKLSPYVNPKTNPFEELRGVTLRFPREMMSQIEDFVHQRIADAAEGAAE